VTGIPAPEGAIPERITRGELRAAIDRLGWYEPRGPEKGSSTHPADRIIRDVERHREPRHEPGAYEDSEGNLHVRVPGLNAWLRVMDDGTTEVRPDDWVERPLRKLVPAPSRDAIYATLANGAARDNVDQLTDRICKLLEGSDEH
jgi:hypothetical protein